MKRYGLLITLLLSVSFLSCAPVLRKDYMDTGIRDVSLSEIKQNPETYKGKVFILGGIIVSTRVTEEGSLIEAIYLHADSRGYPEDGANGRYLALYPRENGIMDPQIYRKGRRITLAAEFADTRQGKIDDAKYVYPLFVIRDFYLWDEKTYYYPAYNYPYYYDPYWWGAAYPYWWPYWRPYPYWW